MPIHTDGQYITAQQLFLRDDGAVWMYDVYGQLHLFDGQNIFTLGQKSATKDPKGISYFDEKFWFIKENKIYSWSSLTKYQIEYELPLNSKQRRLYQTHGIFWGHDGEEFFIYEPKNKSFTRANITDSNTSSIISDIEITGAVYINKRWLISTSEGVFEFDKETKTYSPLFLGQYIDAIFYSEEKDQIVLGTHDSIWLTELEEGQLTIERKIAIEQSLLSFTETNKSFWFGTDNGLYKWNFSNQKLEYFQSVVRDDYSLEGNKIYALLEDKNNGVWVATDNGVSYYSDGNRLFSRIRYKEANGRLDMNEITSVLQTPDESAWFSSHSGLFWINSLDLQSSIHEIMSHHVNDLSYGKGFVWAGTQSGIYRVDRNTKEISVPRGLEAVKDKNIGHLLMDSSGILWFSSDDGLYKYNINTTQLVDLGFSWVLENKYSSKITHLYENKNNQISIGTNMGMYRYENGALTFDYAHIRAGSILDMVDTEYGNSWIVSNYGLQISGQNHERVDVPLSAKYTTPHCVLSTSNGVWLSSSKGLSLYTHQGRLTKHFGNQKGLINNELLAGLCSISSAGTMLFASKEGLLWANEDELLKHQITKPHVIFGQVNINHQAVSYGAENKRLEAIPYGASISFLFGVLPEFQNTALSYQLVGSSDEGWQNIDGSSLVFDSLKPGKYILRIKPRNIGQRTSKVTEFLFYVEVPWFLAPWFIFSVFTFLLCSVISLYFWRSKEIKKSNEQLKKRVERKTMQLSNQGKALISSNHQLQKLLTVRQHVISEMAEQAEQPIREIQSNLQKKGTLTNLLLANQCEYSLTLLKQLTNIEPFVMLQKNNRTNQVFTPLLRAAVKSWKDEYHMKGVELYLDDNSTNCSIFVQPLLIDAIFNNLLFNLLKRSQFGEQVTICIGCDEQRVTAYFLSEGDNISDDELDELKRVDLTEIIEVLNQALGLSSVKRLTVQNGGHFEITKNKLGENELVLSWPIASDILSDKAKYIKPDGNISAEENTQQQWLIGVYQIVEENYHDPAFGTRAVAKALFISERNFQRKFKKITQRSFMEYLIEVKLEKACELLISGSKVADAAFDSGFNDPSYFSRRFKRHYGLSPTQFVTEN